MSELRVTDTNSANDSKGRAFGLEGNDFIYVIAGLVFALGLYLVLTAVLDFGGAAALVTAAPVFLLPLAWASLLRRNKPDGYAEDWFDNVVNRGAWSYAPRAQPIHPREVDDESRRA